MRFGILKEYEKELIREHRIQVRMLKPGVSLSEEEKVSTGKVRTYLLLAGLGVLLLGSAALLSFTDRELPENLALASVIILSFALLFRFRYTDRIKKRRESIEDDYSVIVMSLAGLMIAGYSVRNAWHKLAEDYVISQKGLSKREQRKRMRYAYEELVLTDRRIQHGEAEIEAYREYARILGVREYLRLSELLEQFVRTGRRDVYELWSREHNQALMERKNRMSEKAAKRESALALPMVILLGMIMAMIMVPALMSF